MSTYNLCFEQKYEKYQSFLSENFQFLEVKFSIYLNRRVFVMIFFLFLHKYLMGTQKCLLLMSISLNGCFHGEIKKISVHYP